ncbi:hypothetical protein ACN4EK_10485 [Pantanalinema rosaneae CENA516]|uniref:hypothetical protein n=1 Tax=Pantanalinema rosaneae TaxID=1620701 RepID=UPI003D6FD201
MKHTACKFLLLSFTLGAFPNPAIAQLNPNMQAFCAQVRDSYVSEVSKRLETQHYQGYSKGKGGIGAFDGVGVGGGAEFSYDWQRTWDNFNNTQKRDYQSKNCDEVLRQWGQISIAQIRTNAETAIAKMQLESHKYSEDTRKVLAQIDFESAKVHSQTLVRIEELRQASRLEEAKILAESGERMLKTQQQGETERLQIEKQALMEMNRANNVLDLKKAQLDASVRKQQTLTDLLQQGVKGHFELEKEREITRREIKKLELEIAKLQQQQPTSPVLSNDPNLALLKNWGLTSVPCGGSVVSILIEGKEYCTNAAAWLSTGIYRYDQTADRLEPISQPGPPLINPQLTHQDESL